MSGTLAGLLVRLHDRTWRERFGDECRALLEELPPSASVVADMAGSALVSRRALLVRGVKTAVVAVLLAVSATVALERDGNPSGVTACHNPAATVHAN